MTEIKAEQLLLEKIMRDLNGAKSDCEDFARWHSEHSASINDIKGMITIAVHQLENIAEEYL